MKGGITYTAVTRARSALASRMPALAPFRASREPSTGRRMCLNMRHLCVGWKNQPSPGAARRFDAGQHALRRRGYDGAAILDAEDFMANVSRYNPFDELFNELRNGFW